MAATDNNAIFIPFFNLSPFVFDFVFLHLKRLVPHPFEERVGDRASLCLNHTGCLESNR